MLQSCRVLTEVQRCRHGAGAGAGAGVERFIGLEVHWFGGSEVRRLFRAVQRCRYADVQEWS